MSNDILVQFIEAADIIALTSWRQTCRAFYTVVATVLRRRYIACITPFVADTDYFNGLLRACGAVISGSVALQFVLQNESWVPRDLDIYVPDRMFDTFISVAKRESRMRLKLLPASIPFRRLSGRGGSNGIREVYRFETSSGREVDVIRSAVNSPVTPLNCFWSTLVINFITPDGCACGFPERTLAHKGLLKSNPTTDRDKEAIAKYEGRGFTFISNAGSKTVYDPSSWDPGYFGDTSAIVLPYRLRLSDGLEPFPITRMRRGWQFIRPFPRVTVRTSHRLPLHDVSPSISQAIWRQLRASFRDPLDPDRASQSTNTD